MSTDRAIIRQRILCRGRLSALVQALERPSDAFGKAYGYEVALREAKEALAEPQWWESALTEIEGPKQGGPR